MRRLDRFVAEHRPAVFIADPFSELHVEEENDNTSVRAVIAMFREFAVKHNMAVVILHHTRKGASHAAGDPDIARGASSIVGAVRIAVTLTSMSDDDAKALGLPTGHKARSNYVRMDDAKSNYAPLREAQWFEKMPYELANGELVPAAVPWEPPQAKVASQQDLAGLAAAIEAGCPAVNHEPWSPKLSGDPRSIRCLLRQHGFVGADAERTVLARLRDAFQLTECEYKRPLNRSVAKGWRIGDKPSAAWVEGEPGA